MANMRSARMSQHKLKRLINEAGSEYQFQRSKKDTRGEPVRDSDGNIVYEPVTPINGFYHETGTFFTAMGTDDSITRSKPQPMILTFLDEACSLLQKDDAVFIDSKRYDVIIVRDVENFGIYADISMELFEDGGPRT